MAAKKKTDAASDAPEVTETVAEATPEPVTEPPSAPDPFRFNVEPRLVDHVVLVDVKRGGEVIGTITAQLNAGFNGVYTAMHEVSGALANLLRQVHDDAYAAGIAANTAPEPTK